MRARPGPTWWHVPLLLLLSAGYEYRFIHHGMNTYDEGWPLYAAMALHKGGTLYHDVFFVFPPLHLLPAWIGYGLDPPGIIPTRFIYAAFSVALCIGIYEIGRRLMPPIYALYGAALLAIAAPFSHGAHLLFGYRYLVLTIPALLAFHRRVLTGNHRWMFVAGLAAGIAVSFRLTPAFSVGVALGFAVIVADRSWRSWLRDWSWLAAGIVVALLPVLAWFASGVGIDVLWREVIDRPLSMLQPKPIPEVVIPGWNRDKISQPFWVSLQFRIFPLIYACYALTLIAEWIRSLWQRRPFEHALMLAVVLWGGTFFIRATGRADIAHVESAIPPVCILLGHIVFLVGRGLHSAGLKVTEARALQVTLCAAIVAAWILLPATDRAMTGKVRGSRLFQSSGEKIYMVPGTWSRALDNTLRALQREGKPGARILDLSAAPMFHVLSGFMGPGYFDVIAPGTFIDDREEEFFLEKLKESPPDFVLWPERPFDTSPDRTLRKIAPRIKRWAHDNYAPSGPRAIWLLLRPRDPEFESSP